MYAYQKAILAMLEETFAAEDESIEKTVAALCAAITEKRTIIFLARAMRAFLPKKCITARAG